MKKHDNRHLEKILGADLKELPALHYKNKPLVSPELIKDNKTYPVEVRQEVFEDHNLVQRFIIGNHKELNPKPRYLYKFELNENETIEANEWIEEHSKVCPVSFAKGNLPTAGEHYYFKFIPHGLGTTCRVGCLYCKDASKDITDISNW